MRHTWKLYLNFDPALPLKQGQLRLLVQKIESRRGGLDLGVKKQHTNWSGSLISDQNIGGLEVINDIHPPD